MDNRDALYYDFSAVTTEGKTQTLDTEATFRTMLRRLRKARDLRQAALAQQAYHALDTIKKIETGRRQPSRQLAVQFADVLALAGDERAAFLAAARATFSSAPADCATPSVPEPSAPPLFVFLEGDTYDERLDMAGVRFD